MQVRTPRPCTRSGARGCLLAALSLAICQAQPRWLGGVWGVSPPCCCPNHKHRVGCPHALLGSQRPSREPTPVHEEPRPLEASLPVRSSPAPLCRRTPQAPGPPESGFQQLGIFHRQQQWGHLMSKVAPFPTRLSPSTPSPAVRCCATEALRGSLWSRSPSADGRTLRACRG